MTRFLRSGFLGVLLALLGACGGGGTSERSSACDLDGVIPENDPAAVPADRIDLSHWSLTIPVDANGGTTGQARTVSPAVLTGGYESEWFYASDDGGVALWAPVNGAKTPNSQYARSELRELIDPADQTVNWKIADTAQMTATASVSQVQSANRKVIVGKIVAYSTAEEDLTALLHVIYFVHGDTCRASLYGLLSEGPAKGSPVQTLTLVNDALLLGQEFGFTVRVVNGVLTLRSGTTEVTATINPAWADVPVYFRAGAGLNSTGTSATDGANVTFYSLAVTH